MKKLFTSLMCIALLSSATNFAYEEPPITLVLDDIPLKMDVPPTIKRNATYVPIGLIAKELGATVEWNPPKITITTDDLKLELEIGRMQIKRNGEGYPMMAAPYLSEGRTMVPLRVVSNQLGCTVAFDDSEKNKVIRLTKTDNKFVPPPAIDVEGFEKSPDGKWGVKYVDYDYEKTLYLMDNKTEIVYEIYTDIELNDFSSINPVQRWVGDNRLMFYGSVNDNRRYRETCLMIYGPTTKKTSYIEKTGVISATYVKDKDSIIYTKRADHKINKADYAYNGKLAYYRYSLKNNTSTKISEGRFFELLKLVYPDSD